MEIKVLLHLHTVLSKFYYCNFFRVIHKLVGLGLSIKSFDMTDHVLTNV